MRFVLAAGLLAALLAAPCGAQETPTESPKRPVILKLMQITRSAELGVQMRDQMLAQIKQISPEAPAELLDELGSMFDPAELQEATVPIYERNFSLEELEALVAFYESPLGETLLTKMPAVMQEALAVGNEIGMRKAEAMIERLKERGFMPPPP